MVCKEDRSCERQHGGQSVSWLIAFPVTILLLLTVIQFGAWWLSYHDATKAADIAYYTARVRGASATEGITAGQQSAGESSTIKNMVVEVSKTGETVTVTITGEAPSLSPFWSGPAITRTVSGPSEDSF